MSRRRSGSWRNRKTVRNLQYLERIERKKQMPRILDPLGLTAGGNHEPQQMQFNPVLQLLWPIYCQTLHDLMACAPVNRPNAANTAEGIVNVAWEVANRTFQWMGFEFVFPMGVRVIPPTELHESDKAHAEAGEVHTLPSEVSGEENA